MCLCEKIKLPVLGDKNGFRRSSHIIMKYTIKTGNITQVTLLTNVMHYLSNEVTVLSLILHNIITTSIEVTNLVSNPLSNA